MTVFRGDPLLAELASMSEDMDRAFGRLLAPQGGSRGWLPPADIFETDDDVVIQLDVPGCHFENLSVEAVNGQLIVAGEREPDTTPGRRYRQERWSGRFVRTFTLPSGLSVDDIHADYHEGVLAVRLRKPEETKPRRISINRERKALTEKAS
jgi:HSP20 family protein